MSKKEKKVKASFLDSQEWRDTMGFLKNKNDTSSQNIDTEDSK